jgi:hypothetical protein
VCKFPCYNLSHIPSCISLGVVLLYHMEDLCIVFPILFSIVVLSYIPNSRVPFGFGFVGVLDGSNSNRNDVES